ncbi:MAG: oligosaccharide flippase family protein [Bacteroidia bacterium]
MKKYLSSYWIRSAFFTFLQRFSITIFTFVNFFILVRAFTKAEMGLWAFFTVVTTLFESIKSNLLKNAHIKFVGNKKEEKTAVASSSLLLNASLNLCFILFLFLFSGKLSYWIGAGKELEGMLRLFIPGILFLIFFSHLEAVAQSHLDFKAVFAGNFARQALFFLIILGHAAFKIRFTLPHIVVYQIICIGVGAIVLFFYSKKHLLFIFNPSIKWIKELVSFGGYIFGIGILVNIFGNLDQLMIARFTSKTSMVANYNAATRISTMISIPSYAAAEILLPKVSQVDLSKGYDQIKYMYERMVGVLLCFTTPVALIIFLFPKFVITIVAGARYQDAAFILQMYMLSAIVLPIQNQAANILLYIGKARLCFLLNLLFLGINFGLNYLCFTEFGPYGAAIGNVIGCTLGTIVWYLVLRKSVDIEYNNIAKYIGNTYKFMYSKAISITKLKQAKTIV